MKASQSVKNSTYGRVNKKLEELRRLGEATHEFVSGGPIGTGTKREINTMPPKMPQYKPATFHETSDGIIISYYPVKLGKDGKVVANIQYGKNSRGEAMAIGGELVHTEETIFFQWKPTTTGEKIGDTIDKAKKIIEGDNED